MVAFRDLFNNVTGYEYMILVIGGIIIYGLNFGDYKEDSIFCAGYYEDPFVNSNQVMLLYWQEYNLCCHYALDQENMIIQECQ